MKVPKAEYSRTRLRERILVSMMTLALLFAAWPQNLAAYQDAQGSAQSAGNQPPEAQSYPQQTRDQLQQLVAPILRALAQFARTGLHGTTPLTLAQAAGISEAILSVHFGDKTLLFREAVENNTEVRLRSLDRHLSSIAAENHIDWIERMAEATIMVCVAGAANAILMNWALLEAPEFATDLYRNEVGSVRILWEREVARRFPASRTGEIVSLHIVPYAVNTCLAHGLWLATLRHPPESAEPLARQFAISIAKSASVVLGHS